MPAWTPARRCYEHIMSHRPGSREYYQKMKRWRKCKKSCKELKDSRDKPWYKNPCAYFVGTFVIVFDVSHLLNIYDEY
jgi:hypothetical protein